MRKKTRCVNCLSHFDVNEQYTAEKNVPLTDYLCKVERKTDEQHEMEAKKEFVINRIYGLCILVGERKDHPVYRTIGVVTKNGPITARHAHA